MEKKDKDTYEWDSKTRDSERDRERGAQTK